MQALTRFVGLLTAPLLIICSCASMAHNKSDVITLYNGDHITGEVKGLSAGRLQVGTDYSQDIFLEWPKVARIDSRYNFEVRLDNAERLYGNLSANDKNGELQFTSIDDLRTLDMLSVVEIRPIEETFEDRLDYSIGATFQLEPELRTNQLTAEISYEDRESITLANARLSESVTKISSSEGNQSESTSAASLKLERQRWTNRGELYRSITSSYEMNEALGNDGRVSVGAGLGRYFIDRSGMRLSASAGIQGIVERNALTDLEDRLSRSINNLRIGESPSTLATQDYEKWHRAAEGFIQSTWRVYEFGDNDMDITVSGNVYPSLSDWGRIRASASAAVDWEVYSDVYWTLSAQADFDSDSDASISGGIPDNPSDTPVGTFDYMITMGFSWKP